MKQTGKKLLSYLLILAMVVGLVPGMRLMAYAASSTVTWNASDITGQGNSFTKDGVTVNCGDLDYSNKNFMDGGTFTTTLGNFTKIEVTTGEWEASGTGWSGSTWTGNASSVSFSGEIYEVTKVVFTIEPATVAVTGVELDPATLSLTVGDATATLTATVQPDGATDKTVTWTTSDASIATVDNGVVTPKAAGTATITATATNGTEDTSDDKTATCTVTVSDSQAALQNAQSALETSILEANDYATSIVESHENEAVTVWNSVETATGVRNNATSVAELQSAKETLDQVVAKTKLEISIEEAESYYNDIQGSHADAAATLLSAINTAKGVKDNTNATVQQLTEAKTALDNALATAQAQAAAAQQSDTYTFYVTDSLDWGSACAYAWDSDGNALLGEWPGTAVSTGTTELGDTQFIVQLPKTAVGFIVNGGGAQTEDITNFSYDGFWMDGSKNALGHYLVTGYNFETTEPEPPAPADTYVVAGSKDDIFGSTWDGTSEANKMTLANGTYTKSYTVSQAYTGVQLKVVKNGTTWIGDQSGNNVTFNLTGAGTFTVSYNPSTNAVSVSGDIVASESAETTLTVGTTWYVGDAFNPGAAWVNYYDTDAAYLMHSTGAGSVSQPIYDGDLAMWCFGALCPADKYSVHGSEGAPDEGNLPLYFTVPDGKSEEETPTGFRLTGGDGTKDSPYTFALVYDEKPAPAAETVTYGEHTCTVLDANSTSLTDGWYIVKAGETVTIPAAVTVSGDVHLVLQEGATLNTQAGIAGGEGSLLTVEGSGALNATAAEDGSNAIVIEQLTVNGGSVTVNTDQDGIVLRRSAAITGGTVNVTAANGDGISVEDRDGNLTISGGSVEVRGKQGIGVNGQVAVSGGTVHAVATGTGEMDSAIVGVGGITVSGGSVTAEGISLGLLSYDNVQITDGSVTASGSTAVYSNNVSVSGGDVTATGSTNGLAAENSVSISGGDVTATGSAYGLAAMQSVSIQGGTVTATTEGEEGAVYGTTVTVAEGLTVTASDDATSAAAVSDFATNHSQKYVHIEAPQAAETVTYGEHTCTVLDANSTSWTDGWYIVKEGETVTIPAAVAVSGDVHLVLQEGATLNTQAGIAGAEGSLTVEGSGTLNAAAAETGSTEDESYAIVIAQLTVNGGSVSAGGGDQAILAGNLTINGGSVTVNTDKNGIEVIQSATITGGTVNVTANRLGISSQRGGITISGGSVDVTGDQAIYFKGLVAVSGGTVHAVATGNAVLDSAIVGEGGITVSGGSVTAQGYGYGLLGYSKVLITDGSVTASGSIAAYSFDVEISGGNVTANGGSTYGLAAMDSMSISGGTVTATGDMGAVYCEKGVTVADGLAVTAGDDATSAAAVSDFATNHSQKYVEIKAAAAEPVNTTGTIVMSEQGFYYGQTVETITKDGITVVAGKGDNGSNSAPYYAAGESLDVDPGNTLTVSVASGTITQIVFTYGSSNANEITADSGTFDTNTWTGSAQSVTFTFGGTSGKRKIKEIAVTYSASAPAAETVTYTDGNGTEHTCTVVDANSTSWTDGWYIVKEGETVTIPAAVTVSGDVHLVLQEGATLNVNDSVSLWMESNALTIEGSGTLNAVCDGANAAIYGDGALTVNGGSVVATGGSRNGITVGTVAVSGGTVTATGSDAGIRAEKDLTISGGTVHATGNTPQEGVAIESKKGNITISGGEVEAEGTAAGISAAEGAVTISGGTVTATGGSTGIAGLQSVSIQGGTVNATGGGAGILCLQSVSIQGGTVTVTATTEGGLGAVYAQEGVTVADGLAVTAGDDATNAAAVSDFATNHSQKYVHIEEAPAVATVDGTSYSSFAEALSAWAGGAGTTLTLAGDVTVDSTVTISGTKTLDLNGYGIKRTGSGTVLEISDGASLTLNDSTPARTDTGDNRPAGVTGGYITGGTGTDVYGGLVIAGGVYNAGTFTMNGGSITSNSANLGGGVYNAGSFTMNGGSITGNSGANYGGGVCNDFGEFTMTGGSITGNSGNLGGGVMNSYGTLNLSGAPVITGNTGSDLTNITASVAVTGALTGEGPIRVMVLDSEGAPTSGSFAQAGGNYSLTDDDAAKFTSDLSDYVVKRDGNTLLLASAHTHSFSYSASGDTVTATCTADGCDNPAFSAALTVTAPTLTTYGGTGDAAATLTGLDAFNTATEKTVSAADILYVGRNDTTYEESATAPTAAGQYTAKLTVEGQTAQVDYEIGKAAGSISYASTVLGRIYGAAPFTNTLTNTGDGAVSYASDNTAVAIVDSASGAVTIVGAGTVRITATVTDGANYTYAKKTASYTLYVDPLTMSVSATPYTGSYDGASHGISVSVTTPADGYTVKYGTAAGSYTLDDSPSYTDVGTYTVYYQVTANGYTEVNDSSTVTISKATPSYTVPSGLTATYGQTLADVSLPEGWSWKDSTQSVGNAGSNSFQAVFTPADTGNYHVVNDVDVTVAVEKAANPATVAGTATVIKGGNTLDLSANVTMNGATGAVGYELSDNAPGCTLSGSILTTGENTGSVTVNVTVAADANYNALAATPITVTVTDKLTQTISAENMTLTYGDTGKSVSASVTDPATGGGAIRYAVKTGSEDTIGVNAETGALTVIKAGTATVIVTAAETQTHAQATRELTVTVNKANPSETAPTGLTATYGDTLAAVTLPEGWSWKDSTQSVGNAGSNSFQAVFTPSDTVNYNVLSDVDVTVNVNRAAITPTVSLAGWVYGQSANTPVVGGNTGNGAETITYAVRDSGNFAATQPTDAGSYTVKLEIAQTANYLGGTATADFTITPAALTVTATGYTGAYDGQAHGIGVDVGDSGASVYYAANELTAQNFATAGSTTAPSYSDVGEYTVYYYVYSKNYTPDVAAGSQTVSIEQAAAPAAESLTDAQKPAAKAELIADGSEQPLVTAPTLPEGYTKVQYSLDGETWTDEIPTGKDPGDYSVQVKYVGDKNHSDFEGETVNVTVGSLTVSFADSDVAAQSVIRNGKLERPANPSREGYAFDGWFEDATCTVPYDFNKTVTGNMTLYAKWTPNVYQLTNVTGATTDANHIWYKQSGTETVTNNNTGVEVTVKLTNGPDNSFDHFTGVQLDGVTLTRDVDYAARAGSTVVTLFPATLRRLSNGAHTLTVLFDNNSVSTRLTVRQNSSTPATGDESNAALYLTILVLSALGMAAVTVESKKRRTAKR